MIHLKMPEDLLCMLELIKFQVGLVKESKANIQAHSLKYLFSNQLMITQLITLFYKAKGTEFDVVIKPF
jgi:hypothetical protein